MKYNFIYFQGDDGYEEQIEANNMLEAVKWIFENIEFDHIQSIEESNIN